ncbi:MAG: hypothetical protein KJ621_14475 [Proteobacteria bacterium]|nr:hypothetical protein [Pseudomonadota bacterium]MBU1741933.1 hypothetical protein [Pseudomonadota bacterium]
MPVMNRMSHDPVTIKKVKVRERMRSDPITVHVHDPVEESARVMMSHKIGRAAAGEVS